jgi:phosphoribosyl 1,2-cyclic phosphodiesterase
LSSWLLTPGSSLDPVAPWLSHRRRILGGMGMTISVLGSGSRGNATFVRTDQARLLIDAGISRKEIGRRLESLGEDPEGIDAILVTHEHNDHACALRMLVKEMPVRAYLTAGTIRALRAEEFETNGSTVVPIISEVPFTVGDAVITPFRVPHDAVEPVAFSICAGGARLTQITDVGWLPQSVAQQLRNSDVLIMESNHDLEMLRAGPYPWTLKQRLMSRFGHLSNTAVARFITDLYDGRAQHLVLAHLSARNNHPEIARQEAIRALRARALSTAGLMVTQQDVPSPPIRLQ